MSDFKKWFKSLNENGRVTYFLGQEGRISEEAWNHQQAIIDEHTEVIKLQDTDLRKYEKQIENLKEQLNNMEQCYIGKKKQVEDALSRIEGLMVHAVADYENTKSTSMMCAVQGVEKALRGAND